MTLTNIQLFRSDDINELNRILWETIYNKGKPLHFGDKDEEKDAKEIFAVIQIHGKALTDMYNGKLPKGWRFGEKANKEYVEMLFNPDKGEQPYTYGERLHNQACWDGTILEFEHENYSTGEISYTEEFDGCECINQLEIHREMLKEAIETGIHSNRIYGDIGKPTDLKLKDPPCFRGWQLKVSEKNKVSLRIVMRSSDAGNAYAANLCGFVRVFIDEVIKPAGGVLEEVIFVAMSSHLYDNDLDMVEALIGKKPSFIKRWAKA